MADTAGSKFPKEATKHRPLLAKYIASGKIKSPAQFEAAVKHLKANKDAEISIEAFEKDSGVGKLKTILNFENKQILRSDHENYDFNKAKIN